jgi:putative addiction module antidote
MDVLKLTQVGNSVGVILPRDLLRRMNVDKGDQVFVTQSPAGWVLTPYDPTVAEQVEAGRKFMKQYRDTFRALAK